MHPVAHTWIHGIFSYSDSSASESPSPSTTPLSATPERQEHILQDATKAKMDKLKGATYQVDLTAEGAIFHVDTKLIQTVLNRLQNDHNITTEMLTADLEGHSSAINPRFLRDGFMLLVEPDSYDPLVHLLNKIIDATNEHMGSYLSGLHIHHFEKEVNTKYGCYKGLKLGGIGLIGNLPTEKEVSWEAIEIIINSKRAAKQSYELFFIF